MPDMQLPGSPDTETTTPSEKREEYGIERQQQQQIEQKSKQTNDATTTEATNERTTM